MVQTEQHYIIVMSNINTKFIDKLKNADGLFLIEENDIETEEIPCSIGYEEEDEPFFHFTNNGYDGMIDTIYLSEAETADIAYEAETKTYIVKRKDDEDLKVRFFYIG